MRFGLDVAQHQLTWEELRDRVQLAERLGFDGAWLFDHFKPLYGDPRGPCLEAWTLLAALAQATERIRLGALVTGVTYRHPSVLAAEVLTVDHVSAGRLELGLGAAWYEDEHRELGIPFPPTGERIDRLAEAIDVLRALLTRDDATLEGRHYRLDHASLHPRPVQQPHPPLWIGALGERRMLPLVGRVADVWHADADPATLARKSRIVDEHAERAGRNPQAILRASNVSLAQSLEDVRRDVESHLEIGCDYLIASWPESGAEQVEAFAAEVVPAYAGARS